MKPLTSTMRRVIDTLRDAGRPKTANQIAYELGFWTGQDDGRHSHNGRAMAPAQRVIFPLIGLISRGLVTRTTRTDGLSGTAFMITAKGLEYLECVDLYGGRYPDGAT